MNCTILVCILLSIVGGLLLDMYLEQVVDRRGGTLSWSTKDVMRKVIMAFYFVLTLLLYARYFLSEFSKGISSFF